jgi:hypothetical protein
LQRKIRQVNPHDIHFVGMFLKHLHQSQSRQTSLTIIRAHSSRHCMMTKRPTKQLSIIRSCLLLAIQPWGYRCHPN